MTMIMRNIRWILNWSPCVPGTEVPRITFLTKLKRYSEESLHDENPQRFVWELGKHGVLNMSQIAAALGTPKQRLHRQLIQDNQRLDTEHTVRGKFDPRSIPAMLEIVTRLVGEDSIPYHLFLEVQSHSDKSIVEHLTGVPVHTLRNIRKHHEN